VFTGLTILARRGFRGYAQRSIQVKKQDDAPRESMSERIAAWLEEPYEPTGWPDAEWSLDRPVCPCCGCIASHGFVCDVCDWEEPLDSSGAPIASPDRDALLAKARESYEATGSVMSVEERASWGGLLTPREIELRKRIRERCAYLRAGDRSDTSEVLEEVDRLLEELRQASRKSVGDWPGSVQED